MLEIIVAALILGALVGFLALVGVAALRRGTDTRPLEREPRGWAI